MISHLSPIITSRPPSRQDGCTVHMRVLAGLIF